LTPERFELVKQLVARLEELPAAERSAYLDRECSDPDIRTEVESLFAHDVPSIVRTGGVASRIAPVIADDGAALGRHVGPYRLLDVLGEGGMGVVYRAEQTAPIQRQVALKLVPFGMDTSQVLARFEVERQALALMNHPFIAHGLEAGAGEDGRPYFVMELVDGEPITDYCARENPPLVDRLRLFLQICEAIQHAHQRGIIHRDLKPSNVLLTKSGTTVVPKIIDFGIAKAVGDAASTPVLTTQRGQIVGTPEYMSPEQAGVIDAGLDTRSDVYSLGVMLYELVTGRRPYELAKRTHVELERALRTPPLPPSQVVNAGTSSHWQSQTFRDIDAVVLMAMERLPDDRYASVEQLASDVRAIIEVRPVRARVHSWSYRTQKFVRRHAASVATAAVMAGVIAAGIVGIVQQRNRAIASEARAIDEAARARTEADKASAVATFLTDLFRESDPANARGRVVTARELLDRGAAQLSNGLSAHDAVRAELMHTIAGVYRALGLFDEAERFSTGALTLRRELFGSEHPDIAASLDDLGQIARDRTFYEQAVRLHREALVMRRTLLAHDHPDVAQSLSNLALALRERGEYVEAEQLAREALDIRRRRLGSDHPDTLVTTNVLGDIQSSTGKFADAERSYMFVLEARRRLLPPDHPRIAVSLNNAGDAAHRSGRLFDAEKLYREALNIRRRILDPDHVDATASMVNLAAVLQALGQLDEAEALFREALAADRRRMGNQNMDVAIDLNNLGSLLEERGQLAEAGRLYEESRAIRVALQGESHPSVATILMRMGQLRLREGSLGAAESALRRAIDIREAHGLGNLPRQAETMVALGRVLERRNETAAANQQYEAAVAITRSATPEGSPTLASALLALGQMRLQQRDAPAAEGLLRESLELRRRSLPAGHRAIGEVEAALGESLLEQSKLVEAEALLVTALETAPHAQPPETYRRQAVLELLVMLHERAGRRDAAASFRAALSAQ
jgi:serine/threonine protein kinase/tetratricopeptide (TPR) repeat protein